VTLIQVHVTSCIWVSGHTAEGLTMPL
jgi:hypothetical protein